MGKIMELNMFTRKAGYNASEELYEIGIEDYWKVYFRLLATIGQTINQREEDIMAYILSRPKQEPKNLEGRHVVIPAERFVEEGVARVRCMCGRMDTHESHVDEAELRDIYSNATEYVDIDYFTAPHANLMRVKLNLARSEVTRLKNGLKLKKIITDTNQPVPALENLRQHTMNFKAVSFVLPMKIVV